MSEDNWRDCCGWLTRVGLLSAEHRANSPSATVKDLAYNLRDGVQICRLLNLVQPNALDLKEISQKPQMAQFLCLRNIRTFLQVCKNVFELKETDLFQPQMLFDLSDFGKVLFTLSKLSNCAKAQRCGIPGFSVLSSGTDEQTALLDEDICQNLEELASEPTTPAALPPQPKKDQDESIYEELCYITFRIPQVRKNMLLSQPFEPDEEMEDYYAVVVQTEEDIYQDLCYIDRQSKQQPQVAFREKRDYVKGELLETETNYVDALGMLRKKFMKPLQNCMKEEDRRVVFLGIKELCEIHTGFLSDLSRVLSSTNGSHSGISTSSYTSYNSLPPRTLGDCFNHWKDKFIIYGDYCANLTRAQTHIEELANKSETLSNEIIRLEKDANGGRFKLRDLLSVPMQRVLKYHLLLQKLLDETSWDKHGYDEFKSVEKARDIMFDVADFTNEVKRDSETLTIIRQIEHSIVDLKMPPEMELKDYGRLQKDGELRIRSHDDNRLKSRYVFIFDKVMLMCKTTRGEQYSYKHSLCLQEYRVEDVPAGTMKKTSLRELRWSFCWNLVHHKEKNVYTMFAQTMEQKRRWIKAIEDALTNIQPEESRRTDHSLSMHTFERGALCTHCNKFLRGIFFQGYKCVRCGVQAHRECILQLPRCGKMQPPALPPRPPLLPIVNPVVGNVAESPTTNNPVSLAFFSSERPISLKSNGSGRISSSPSSPALPLNNLNSPCKSNGMRLSIAQPAHQYVNLNHLENYEWYAGEMDRDHATTVLAQQSNGTYLVRVRPGQQGPTPIDAAYALSLKWNDQVKHMKIQLSCTDEKLYHLSESRYFKSIVELVSWYEQNSLAESFSGLDACLERAFKRINYTATSSTPTPPLVELNAENGDPSNHLAFDPTDAVQNSNSPRHSLSRVPVTPS